MNFGNLQFGKGKQTLIFLHGWQQDKKSFLPLVPYFPKEIKLIFLDLPGFGQTPKLSENYDSYDCAKEVVNWIKDKKFKNITLIGHSWGGKIAGIIAALNNNLVNKLILVDSSGMTKGSYLNKIIKIIPSGIKNFISPVLIKFIASDDYINAGNRRELLKRIVKENVRGVFTRINTPTLIIWGKSDNQTPIENAYEINNLIPKSKLSILSGGHFPFWDNPQKVANLITAFVCK